MSSLKKCSATEQSENAVVVFRQIHIKAHCVSLISLTNSYNNDINRCCRRLNAFIDFKDRRRAKPTI